MKSRTFICAQFQPLIQENVMQSDLTPFRQWCWNNGFGVTTGYKLANAGLIKIVKLGKLSMVTRAEAERFANSLPAYKADSKEA
jgi:hypothetical protein